MGGLEKGGGDEGREGEDCGICRIYFKRNVVGKELRSNHGDFPCVRKSSEVSDIMCGSNSFTSRPSVDPRGCVDQPPPGPRARGCVEAGAMLCGSKNITGRPWTREAASRPAAGRKVDANQAWAALSVLPL